MPATSNHSNRDSVQMHSRNSQDYDNNDSRGHSRSGRADDGTTVGGSGGGYSGGVSSTGGYGGGGNYGPRR